MSDYEYEMSLNTDEYASEDYDEEEDDEEIDEDDFSMDEDFISDNVYDTSVGDNTRKEFEVIDAEKLINNQQQKILQTSETLGIPIGSSGSLLRYFKWDQEK